MNSINEIAQNNKQLVHLVYFARSGSTFLASMLEMHPDVSVSTESGFLKYLCQLSPNRINKFDEVINQLAQSDRGFSNLVKNDSLVRDYYAHCRNVDYYGVANAILRSHFGENNKAGCWVVKSLKCGWNIPDIAKKLPEIKFIHIYRDGRAVLNSLMRTKKVYATGQMAEEPLTPSLLWRGWMKYINNLDAALSERVCHVQYEELLKNPKEQLARIFTFLGVKHISLDENALSNYAKRIPALETSLHPNVGKGPILDRQFRWQSELPEENIRIFEMVNARILIQMGYPLLYEPKWQELLSIPIMKALFVSLVRIGRRQLKKITHKK